MQSAVWHHVLESAQLQQATRKRTAPTSYKTKPLPEYKNPHLMTKLSAYSGNGSVVKLHFPRTETMLDTFRSVATRQSV
jgi:hypothetical protein